MWPVSVKTGAGRQLTIDHDYGGNNNMASAHTKHQSVQDWRVNLPEGSVEME